MSTIHFLLCYRQSFFCLVLPTVDALWGCQNIKTGFDPSTFRKRGHIFKIMAPDCCCWIICMSCLLLPEIKSKSLETRQPLFFFFSFFNVTETLLNASFDFPTFDWFFINCWIWKPQQTSESICRFIFGTAKLLQPWDCWIFTLI